MATNPYVNKVQKADGSVIIDISDTTAVASDVANGKNFYLATGEKVTGTASGGSGAISVVDTTDSHGGTVRTITAVDISDTTAAASDVASGKYFYTADGTKTAGTASGGGGGLEYESGTWTPASDTAQPTIYFTNAHSEPPMFVSIATDGSTSTDMTYLAVTVSRYNAIIDSYVHTSSTDYGMRTEERRASRGAYAVSHLLLESESDIEVYVTEESFTPQGNYGSAYGYWRSSLTYKWIAVWAPTT